MVTLFRSDHDAGVEAGEGVTQEEVLAFFAANIERMRSLVTEVVEALPTDRTCPCAHALDSIKLPIELP